MNRIRETILRRLEEMGQGPKRSLGQNFLVSEHVIQKILQAASDLAAPALVEVGPGLGSLTEGLLGLAKPLTLIELDTKIAQYWRSREARVVEVVEADALQLDWEELSLPQGSALISNLPYQISSSLVIERSLRPAALEAMVLMFQKEVAQRLMAKPATKDYGLLTVIAQVFWEIRTVTDAGPKDFYPPPRVASRVLLFKRKPTPTFAGKPEAADDFLAFVKAGYSHRRKLLTRNLVQGYLAQRCQDSGEGRAEALIASGLAALGLPATSRAEELDPQQFVRLYEICSARDDRHR